MKKHIKQRKRNIKSSSQFVGCKTKEFTNRYREVLIFFVFGRSVGVCWKRPRPVDPEPRWSPDNGDRWSVLLMTIEPFVGRRDHPL